jgi:ribonuclease Z
MKQLKSLLALLCITTASLLLSMPAHALQAGDTIYLKASGDTINNATVQFYDSEDNSVDISSLSPDTNYSAKAAERVKGVDLMYHEATYALSEEQWAKGRGHSTTIDAAKVALKAEAKRLIIGHFSSRYKDYDVLVEECKTIFENTALAAEGETFIIEERR